MLTELVPANARLALTVSAPLTVSAADKVMVVVPETVSVPQADTTSTVGLLAVLGIVTISPATGWPVLGVQLPLVLQLLPLDPVQV